MNLSFAVTWDYRCPFARNATEHILTGLEAGAEWEVRFVPWSLSRGHIEAGGRSVWEQPEQDSGIVALQVGVVVQDRFAEHFAAVHRALFEARHDHAKQLNNRAMLSEVLEANTIDSNEVFAMIDTGEVLQQVQREHERVVASHDVWGVPTFIAGEHAAFVRLMNRSLRNADADKAIAAVEHIVSMLTEFPSLNEFKHTTLSR